MHMEKNIRFYKWLQIRKKIYQPTNIKQKKANRSLSFREIGWGSNLPQNLIVGPFLKPLRGKTVGDKYGRTKEV